MRASDRKICVVLGMSTEVNPRRVAGGGRLCGGASASIGIIKFHPVPETGWERYGQKGKDDGA